MKTIRENLPLILFDVVIALALLFAVAGCTTTGGAPFMVVDATTFEYGLGAQGTSHVLTKLEVNAADLTGVTVFGE